MNEEQLREEFDKQFQYGDEASFRDIADFWLKKIKEARLSAIQEVIDTIGKIEKDMPTAWFPESAVHLKRKYYEQTLSALLESLKQNEN